MRATPPHPQRVFMQQRRRGTPGLRVKLKLRARRTNVQPTFSLDIEDHTSRDRAHEAAPPPPSGHGRAGTTSVPRASPPPDARPLHLGLRLRPM